MTCPQFDFCQSYFINMLLPLLFILSLLPFSRYQLRSICRLTKSFCGAGTPVPHISLRWKMEDHVSKSLKIVAFLRKFLGTHSSILCYDVCFAKVSIYLSYCCISIIFLSPGIAWSLNTCICTMSS